MAADQVINNVYVAELPDDSHEESVRSMFNQYATVTSVKVLPATSTKKAAALIKFASEEEAKFVVEALNGNIPAGLDTPIQVRYANNKLRREEPGYLSTADKGYGRASARPSSTPANVPERSSRLRTPSPYRGRAAGHSRWGDDGTGGPGSAAPPRPSLLEAVLTSMGGAPSQLSGKRKGQSMSDIGDVVGGLYRAGSIPPGDLEQKSSNPYCLYVSGLPYNTTDFDMYRIFSPFGALFPNGVKAMKLPDGNCSGVGFVDFLEEQGFTLAMTVLDGTKLPDGEILYVRAKGRKGESKGFGKRAM